MIVRYVRPLAFAALSMFTRALFAQCGAGEVEVSIVVHTDDYGYETYWQLVPGGNACGDGTIAEGGNPTMDCNSGGAQQQMQQGYGNNLAITEGPWCLTQDAAYTIYSIDDWGDNAAGFEVLINGISTEYFQDPVATSSFTFPATVPLDRDLTVTELTTALFANVGDAIPVRGTIKNVGATTVTEMELAYSIDGGTPVIGLLSGLSIPPGSSYSFKHPIAWEPSAPGEYEIAVHATTVNGLLDMDPSNDEMSSLHHKIGPVIPDLIPLYLATPPILTTIATSDQDLLVPRDLDFHPDGSRNEVWVINKETEGAGGSTVTFYHAGEPNMTFEWRHDVNAWHFMSLPTGIAMGDNNCFATCPGVFDANHNGGDPFTGPTLWSADTAIYAHNIFGPLGSHLDMLHVDPNSQGIAHEYWNRYWVVDGYRGDIVMNDFRADHGPGNDYHGNAVIRRYADVLITKDPADHVVSHAVMDKRNGMLYVVDFGGQRVLRINTTTGSVSGPGLYGPWENYAEYSMVSGYDHSVIIDQGLVQPAGIELFGDHLIVTDHANGDIILYNIADPGVEEGRIHTNAPGIMGVKVGPDGRIWYVNATNHSLVRVDEQTAAAIAENTNARVAIYPNPAKDVVMMEWNGAGSAAYNVFDPQGRAVLNGTLNMRTNAVDVAHLSPGPYSVVIHGQGATHTATLVVAR